jgi:uncharacterized protein YlxW (UPF0749 family)
LGELVQGRPDLFGRPRADPAFCFFIAKGSISSVCGFFLAYSLFPGEILWETVLSPGSREVLRTILLLAAGTILGLLLSLAWRSPSGGGIPGAAPESARIWPVIEQLEAEQRELKSRLVNVRGELAERQEAAAANTDRLETLRAELDRQKLLAGYTPVQGPGVLVTLDDSDVQVPSGTDPNALIIHEYDLRDVVNLLWMAGSEAIAINDERLVSSSSIYCLGSTVMVNDTRLSPPFSIRAIGNPKVQQSHLRNPSYLKDLKEKKQLYGLRFDVKAAGTIRLPAYAGGFLIRHARPGG